MRSASWVKSGPISRDSRYAIASALYRIFAARRAYLTSARPIRSNRPHAQVAELVDALASGASGLTAVKVRVLSWAPRLVPVAWRGQAEAGQAIALPAPCATCRCTKYIAISETSDVETT